MKKVVWLLSVLLFLSFLLSGCAGTSSSGYTPKVYGSGAIVAVWDLENFSVEDNLILDDLQEFLTAKVAETLKDQGGYVIVERQKLLLALEELSLGSSDLIDQSSQLRVGQLLGAQLMVFGAYQQIGEQIRIDLRLVEVETGAVIRSIEETSSASDASSLLSAAESAALKLL